MKRARPWVLGEEARAGADDGGAALGRRGDVLGGGDPGARSGQGSPPRPGLDVLLRRGSRTPRVPLGRRAVCGGLDLRSSA